MLASIACAQCHTRPTPAQLPPEEWPYLLAWMGNYLGQPADMEINPLLVVKSFVPPQPVVTREQFNAIRSYFLEQAAVQYQPPALAPEPPVTPVFEPIPFAGLPPTISMVAIDATDQSLLIGSSMNRS